MNTFSIRTCPRLVRWHDAGACRSNVRDVQVQVLVVQVHVDMQFLAVCAVIVVCGRLWLCSGLLFPDIFNSFGQAGQEFVKIFLVEKTAAGRLVEAVMRRIKN